MCLHIRPPSLRRARDRCAVEDHDRCDQHSSGRHRTGHRTIVLVHRVLADTSSRNRGGVPAAPARLPAADRRPFAGIAEQSFMARRAGPHIIEVTSGVLSLTTRADSDAGTIITASQATR